MASAVIRREGNLPPCPRVEAASGTTAAAALKEAGTPPCLAPIPDPIPRRVVEEEQEEEEEDEDEGWPLEAKPAVGASAQRRWSERRPISRAP